MFKSVVNILFIFYIITFFITLCNGDCNIYGLTLKVGESKTVPGKCSQITCNGKGYDEHSITACPNAYAPKECQFVPVNLNKPYPDCCPHWSC